jgi:glutamyl-tRNA synthetase/glutamyl-Q tRNA(Asp) synthetase
MPDARTRFAPAPTGRLHLGHVVNAFYVWQTARARQARVLLRIEDHDRQRSRPEFERAILEDLEWLGFVPDEPPFDAFRAGRCEGRQSDRHEIYEGALAMLRSQGLTYACECSRAEIASMAGGAGGDELRYPGTCSRKRLQEQAGRGIRVRLEPSGERFNDLRHGWQGQCPAQQCGDLLVRDRDGNWTYQFAAAVDDLVQGITLVVRGDDLLPSTGRQIQLARLLGRQTAAEFLHHPLIMKSPTQKLSKSDGATGVSELRARGWSPADVVRTAIELVGSSH